MRDREESGFSLMHGVALECLKIYGSLAMMSNNGERTKVTDAAAKKVVIVNIWNQALDKTIQKAQKSHVSKGTQPRT